MIVNTTGVSQAIPQPILASVRQSTLGGDGYEPNLLWKLVCTMPHHIDDAPLTCVNKITGVVNVTNPSIRAMLGFAYYSSNAPVGYTDSTNGILYLPVRRTSNGYPLVLCLVISPSAAVTLCKASGLQQGIFSFVQDGVLQLDRVSGSEVGFGSADPASSRLFTTQDNRVYCLFLRDPANPRPCSR